MSGEDVAGMLQSHLVDLAMVTIGVDVVSEPCQSAINHPVLEGTYVCRSYIQNSKTREIR